MIVVDIAVYSRNHQLTLTVEVKKFHAMSEEWASQYRRNIMAHGTYPLAPFFLLVTSDKFFLWTKNDNRFDITKPNYTVETTKFLKPYFEEFGTTAREASEYILEQVVAKWLKTVMYPMYLTDNSLPGWLRDSGLAEAIYKGEFYFEKVA